MFPSLLLTPLIMCVYLLFGRKRHERNKPLLAVGLFVLGVILQLYIENLTVYLFGCAFLLFAVDWIIARKPSLCFGALLLEQA